MRSRPLVRRSTSSATLSAPKWIGWSVGSWWPKRQARAWAWASDGAASAAAPAAMKPRRDILRIMTCLLFSFAGFRSRLLASG
jgi:hypothetical protein